MTDSVKSTERTRQWAGVLYPENMPDDWQETIGDKLQLPFSYVVHDKDKDSKGNIRKEHVDLIVIWPSPTTYKSALRVFQSLGDESKPPCVNKIERIIGLRHRYDYQIHDTEDCHKKKKYQYKESDRVTGNGFDIGSYEQITVEDKRKILRELSNLIFEKNFCNYAQFYKYVEGNYSDEYFDILVSKGAHFNRLVKGNFHDNIGYNENDLSRVSEANTFTLDKSNTTDDNICGASDERSDT